MDRCGKGENIKFYVENYCVVDLETTDVFINSANIIEISAIKIRNNIVVDEFSTLVNPKCHIPESASAVNHITDDMVENAPCLCEIIDEFCAFIGDDVIVGYNNAAFDMNILYDEIMGLKGTALGNNYIDVLYMARRCLTDVPNCKLETISKHYGLDTEGEHRALKDCYLTKSCYDKIHAEYGDRAFNKNLVSHKTSRSQYSCETILLQELHHFLEAIIEDGTLSYDEFSELKEWIKSHQSLRGNYPFDRVFAALETVLIDGRVTNDELTELQILFEEFVDPVKKAGVHSTITDIAGKHICVTGEFKYGTREDVFRIVEIAGGLIDKTVKKATDVVIVGSLGSEKWKTGNYGGKIQKAMELNENGAKIIIVEEDHIMPYISGLSDCSIESPEMLSNEIKANYRNEIQEMLDELATRYGLLPKSLSIFENYSKDRTKITSYSVSIYEHEYPLSNRTVADPKMRSIVLNFKIKDNIFELMMGNTQFKKVECPDIATHKMSKSEQNVQVTFEGFSKELIEYIRNHTVYVIENYVSKASAFGCCSLYNECSKQGKCLHANLLYSRACQYRKNLEKGNIFYGNN